MGGGGGRRKPPKRGLSREDKALWDAVSRDIEPLKAPKQVRSEEIDANAQPDSRETIQKKIAKNQGSTAESGRRSGDQGSVRGPDRGKSGPTPGLERFDGREAKRIGAGRTKIDGRLDLHGMRQNEAHAALRRFLTAAAARGWRNVLVITGKGRRPPGDDTDWAATIEGERGVLKRIVPNWLAEPEMRAIVVSYTDAHVRHGGEGALYVRLRRKPR